MLSRRSLSLRILIAVTYSNKLLRLIVRASTVSRFRCSLPKLMVFFGNELLRDKVSSDLGNVKELIVSMLRRIQTALRTVIRLHPLSILLLAVDERG